MEKRDRKPKEQSDRKTTSHHSKAEGNYSQFMKDKKKASDERSEKGAKTERSYGSKPNGGRARPESRVRDGEKPKYGERKEGGRGARQYGEKKATESGGRAKPERSYDSKPSGGRARPESRVRDGEKPKYGERREDSRGDKQYGEKPKYGERGDRAKTQRSYDSKPSDKPSGERRSFNPNFTQDNKLIGRRDETSRDRQTGDDESPIRKSYGERGANPSIKGDKKYSPSDKKRAYSDRGSRERTTTDTTKGHSTERRTYADKNKVVHSDKRNDGDKKQTIKDNYPKYPRSKQTSAIRLNRYLAMSGVSSRREADELIRAGVVSVNGAVVTELGTKVEPDDVVKFNDSVVKGESKVYILMNKPKGFVTTVDDPHATKTVMDIIKNACKERVYPVGRLDKDSLGVLLFTNDGDLTKKLTHPSFNKKKVYQVMLDKAVTKSDMEKIVEGVVLEDGAISADAISYVGDTKREVGIEIHSGRNRIVRRIFEHLGYNVISLDRVIFAGMTKKNLRRGAWRFLTTREVEILKSGQYE